jgi:hypothetical protein
MRALEWGEEGANSLGRGVYIYIVNISKVEF